MPFPAKSCCDLSSGRDLLCKSLSLIHLSLVPCVLAVLLGFAFTERRALWLSDITTDSPGSTKRRALLLSDIITGTTGSPGSTERQALWLVTSPLVPLGVFWKLVLLDHALHLEILSQQN